MAAAELTQEEIEHYLELTAAKKTADKIAADKERAARPLKEKIESYVREKGGDDRTTRRHGYVLSLMPLRQAQVKWKDEFIAVAGDERATELAQAQPMTFSLFVGPVAETGE